MRRRQARPEYRVAVLDKEFAGLEARQLIGDGRAVETAVDLEELQMLGVGVELRDADTASAGNSDNAP